MDYEINFLRQIEKAMKEWMSFDSLRVILGDVYVRGMLEEFGHSWQDYDTTSGWLYEYITLYLQLVLQ